MLGAATRVTFRVRLDGLAPKAGHGVDTNSAGDGAVEGHRLYQLIRQDNSGDYRDFEIEFSGPGVEAYAFTFG